jgi:sugar lactone lactonase YvrE
VRHLYLYISLILTAVISSAVEGQIITTVAGTGTQGYSGDGGPATNAELYNPNDVAFDASGNLYIADTGNHRIRKVNASGIITTIAGNGIQGFSGDEGQATNAELNYPRGIAFDASGNLYIADYNNERIRMVNTAGIISTFAGSGTGGFSGDGGQATTAEIYGPNGLSFNIAGNLYIVDYGNNRIRMINTAGIISTIAGSGTSGGYGGDGSAASASQLWMPSGVAFDALGNLYIADYNNKRIRMVNTAGIISTVAGSGTQGFSGDGGQATNAELNDPIKVAIYSTGNLYITDYNNERIRKVNSVGIINTIVGTGTTGYGGDGGQATNAELSDPAGIVFDSVGNLYIADDNNNRIRKVSNVGGQAGIAQLKMQNERFIIYPNPAKDVLNVVLYFDKLSTGSAQDDNATLLITDMLGNTVKQISINSNRLSINVADLAEGIYLLRIETNEGTETKKIIKQ